ncbi:hypothetical protein [Leptospira stimsonii]|uniref:hypothetical protein n=1 Tax=Leptospira stimsonii TaxID=2202203 RepID=UPI0011C40678|nr:hypothetical protein [Leptospira stimsonii]
MAEIKKKEVISAQIREFSSDFQKSLENFERTKLRELFGPKITLTAISGFLSITWFFPKTIIEHPVLSKYIDASNPIFGIFWLFSIVISSLLWYTAYERESYCKNIQVKLSSKAFQREFARQIALDLVRFENSDTGLIERENITSAIHYTLRYQDMDVILYRYGRERGRLISRIFKPLIPEEEIQSFYDLIIEILKQEDILTEFGPSILDKYKLNKEKFANFA